MIQVLNLVGMAAGLGCFVCFIMVVVQAFQHGKTGAGIGLIVSFFCCVGVLIGLIYGWTKAEAWRIKNLMAIYTVCFLVYLGCVAVTAPTQYKDFQDRFQKAMEEAQEKVKQQQPNQPPPGAPAQPAPAPAP
jgi:hypothetical protein